MNLPNAHLDRLYSMQDTVPQQIIKINEHLESMDSMQIDPAVYKDIKTRRIAIKQSLEKSLDAILNLIKKEEDGTYGKPQPIS